MGLTSFLRRGSSSENVPRTPIEGPNPEADELAELNARQAERARLEGAVQTEYLRLVELADDPNGPGVLSNDTSYELREQARANVAAREEALRQPVVEEDQPRMDA